MELAVLVTLSAAALAKHRHDNPPQSTGTLDPWSYWLIRGRKPQI